MDDEYDIDDPRREALRSRLANPDKPPASVAYYKHRFSACRGSGGSYKSTTQ
jgi:hypothetical protein